MLTIAVCAHADCAERASMVSIRTVVIVDLRFQETDIDGDKMHLRIRNEPFCIKVTELVFERPCW